MGSEVASEGPRGFSGGSRGSRGVLRVHLEVSGVFHGNSGDFMGFQKVQWSSRGFEKSVQGVQGFKRISRGNLAIPGAFPEVSGGYVLEGLRGF